LVLLTSAAWALFCPACGKAQAVAGNFCSFCGGALPTDDAPTTPAMQPLRPAVTRPPVSPLPAATPLPTASSLPSATPLPTRGGPPASEIVGPGLVSNQQFLQMLSVFDQYDAELRAIRSNSPNLRVLLQQKLVPGIEAMRRKLQERGVRLTRPQSKLFAMYREMYKTLLEATITLGFQKGVTGEKVDQLTILQDYMRRNIDEETLQAVLKIEEIFAKELQNMHERVVKLENAAGFENPGICYRIKKDEFVANTGNVTFRFYFQTKGKKLGDRMQLYDSSEKNLGRLKFIKEIDGVREYHCVFPVNALAPKNCRSLIVDYAIKGNLSARWQKNRLVLYVLPHVKKDDPVDYDLETFFGQNPSISRKKYLPGLGIR
jgi:hypothetical protein